MLSLTKSDLVARFPEFADEDPTRVANIIEMARDFVDEDAFGTRFKTALLLYSAHLLASTSADMVGAAGPVTLTKVGDLQRQYAQPAGMGGNALGTTKYGMQYLALAKNLFEGGGMFVDEVFLDPNGLSGQPG